MMIVPGAIIKVNNEVKRRFSVTLVFKPGAGEPGSIRASAQIT
jgi:hypothetical protein